MSFFVNTMVCGFSLYQILAFFLIYSCLGWCLEVIYAAVSTGQLVNRGFLNGPVCPIYGFGMIIVLFTLSPLADNLLLLYLGGVILPSVLELVGGWALYKLYHTRWWDYSDFPFNIGGYICLEFSLLWGVGTVVVMKAVHPVIAGFVEMVPQMAGFVLMCILYACYAADVVVTAFAASDLARELDALEKVADSMHAVSDAMTELLGTTAMDVDQKMDESRLQLKLAAAEARDSYDKLSPREAASTMRTRADEAMEAARRASQTARLNAAEAAKAVKLAAQGKAEQTTAFLQLEQLKEELAARAQVMQARTRRGRVRYSDRHVRRSGLPVRELLAPGCLSEPPAAVQEAVRGRFRKRRDPGRSEVAGRPGQQCAVLPRRARCAQHARVHGRRARIAGRRLDRLHQLPGIGRRAAAGHARDGALPRRRHRRRAAAAGRPEDHRADGLLELG